MLLMTRSSPSIVSYALPDFPSFSLCCDWGVNSNLKPVLGMKPCLTEHLSMQFTLGLNCPLFSLPLPTVSEGIPRLGFV